MSNRTIDLTDELYSYLVAHSVPHDPVLEALRKETASNPTAMMQISPEQGQFMTLLVRAMGVRRALEVGVFTGYSATCVARGLPADGELIACDVNEEWTSVARRYWEQAGVADRITLHLRPATETLSRLIEAGEAGRFDFAFIDADKGNYPVYFEHCLTLLRTGGLIGIDNTLWSGAVADPTDNSEDTKVIRALNRQIHEDPRVLSGILPIGDGLTLALKL